VERARWSPSDRQLRWLGKLFVVLYAPFFLDTAVNGLGPDLYPRAARNEVTLFVLYVFCVCYFLWRWTEAALDERLA